jgi:thiol-disulfide isomerase/thioredoxin
MSGSNSDDSKQCKSTKVYNELPLDKFKLIVSGKKNEIIIDKPVLLIVKFGATWCRPCQQIKPLCERQFSEMPDNIICFDIDIDESMDLYVALKKYKMVNGVPCLLAYFLHPNRDDNEWYIPNDSVTGGNPSNVESFFNRCKKMAINYQR